MTRSPGRGFVAGAGLGPLLLAGGAALAALLAGIGPGEWLAGLARPSSWPGLGAQFLACPMPVLRRRGH